MKKKPAAPELVGFFRDADGRSMMRVKGIHELDLVIEDENGMMFEDHVFAQLDRDYPIGHRLRAYHQRVADLRYFKPTPKGFANIAHDPDDDPIAELRPLARVIHAECGNLLGHVVALPVEDADGTVREYRALRTPLERREHLASWLSEWSLYAIEGGDPAAIGVPECVKCGRWLRTPISTYLLATVDGKGPKTIRVQSVKVTHTPE